jgi:hypothetical protein
MKHWLHDCVKQIEAEALRKTLPPFGVMYFKDIDDGWISVAPHAYGNASVRPSVICVRADEDGPTADQAALFTKIEAEFPCCWDAAFRALCDYRAELERPVQSVRQVGDCMLAIDQEEDDEGRQWSLEVYFTDEPEIAYIAHFHGLKCIDVDGAF